MKINTNLAMLSFTSKKPNQDSTTKQQQEQKNT